MKKVLPVETGDHFGFTWMNRGVISYKELDDNDTGHYCSKAGRPRVGDQRVYNLDNSNREFAIKVYYSYDCGEFF